METMLQEERGGRVGERGGGERGGGGIQIWWSAVLIVPRWGAVNVSFRIFLLAVSFPLLLRSFPTHPVSVEDIFRGVLTASHYVKNLMKPAPHYDNIIKIMNEGYNQGEGGLTIIRQTTDKRLRGRVRSARLDHSPLNITIRPQGRGYFSISHVDFTL